MSKALNEALEWGSSTPAQGKPVALSYIVYKEWHDATKDLPDEVQLEIFKARDLYGTIGITPKLSPMAAAVFRFIQGDIDRDREKYSKKVQERSIAGRLGNLKRHHPHLHAQVDAGEITLEEAEKAILSQTIANAANASFESQSSQTVANGRNARKPRLDEDEDYDYNDNEDYNKDEDKNDNIDCAFLVDLWNLELPMHQRVSALTEKRKKKIKTRIGEFGKTKKEQEETCKIIVGKIKVSPFLNGHNDRGWKPNIDWIIKDSDNWRKVYEGNFDQKNQKPASASTGTNTATLPDGRTITLGVGEYIHERGHRTLGQGFNEIPFDAPPRPGNQYYWDRVNGMWNFNSMM